MVVKARGSLKLSFNLQELAIFTLSLPLFAFAFCIVYTFYYEFENSTYTHCEVYNFAPSISAAIGSFIPQKYIWQAAIAIHTGPRILFEYIYNQIFLERLTYLTSGTRRLIRIAFWLAIVEILCLLGLSTAPSQDEFEVHKLCFGAFIATFLGYMVTTLYLLNYCGFKPQNSSELNSLYLKKSILVANFFLVPFLFLFYYLHNEYCKPYIYSYFCMAEYAIVVLNMAYHFMAYLDFKCYLVTLPGDRQVTQYSSIKEEA